MKQHPRHRDVTAAVHQAFSDHGSREWLELGLAGSEWLEDLPGSLPAMEELHAAHVQAAVRLAERIAPWGLAITPMPGEPTFRTIATVNGEQIELLEDRPLEEQDEDYGPIFVRGERDVRAAWIEAIERHLPA